MGAVLLGDPGTKPEKLRAGSFKLQHLTKKGGMALVPIPHKRLYLDSAKKKCPNCQVIHTDSFGHPVKTVHLWLDDQGIVFVSDGVYQDLLKAGMPNLVYRGWFATPPSIIIGKDRSEVDQRNRTIRRWKEPT